LIDLRFRWKCFSPT